MYRKIGVALDDGLTSIHAFQAALKLAQTTDGQLLVVHVMSAAKVLRMGFGVGDNVKLQAEVEQLGRSKVHEALKNIDTGNIPVAIKIIPSFGDDVVKLLLNAVREEECDVLAMGTKGATGLRNLLMGSVAEGVLRRSPVPVLLVHE